jgi:outer membrane protein TolC
MAAVRPLALLGAFLLSGIAAAPAQGQDVPGSADPIVLTLDRALEIALRQNVSVRGAALDVRSAHVQVREAWSAVYPSLTATGAYTRNVLNANPFAGSDIGALFGGGSEAGWVAFNERRRLDDDPTTGPVRFADFVQAQRDSARASGVDLSGPGSNPFGVDNEFRGGVQLEQPLYNGRAFRAIAGAERFKAASRHAQARRRHLAARDVVRAFYEALLAAERERVVRQRVERTAATLQEVTLQVRRGTAPKYRRLSTEVDLSNARSEQIRTANDAARAVDALKQTLGLPIAAAVALEGSLDPDATAPMLQAATAEAVDEALAARPDLEQARLAVELEEVRRQTTRAEFLPRLSAVVNLTYTGRVPDDRSSVSTLNPDDPADPFFYERSTRGFFSDAYWDPAVSVGLNLTWSIFDGFETASQVQRDQIRIEQARLDLEDLERSVAREVRSAGRTMETARERIRSQQVAVEAAEVNYAHAARRVEEGASSQVELRQASDQLDESRFSLLQAAFDYRMALATLETALGRMPSATPPDRLLRTDARY